MGVTTLASLVALTLSGRAAAANGTGTTAGTVTNVALTPALAEPPSNPPSMMANNTGPKAALQARMMLLPQGLRAILRSGIRVQVSANEAANGIAQVVISRATARRLHIKARRVGAVVIGSGTLSQVKAGNVVLHLSLSHATVTKLKRTKHATLTVRLALVGTAGDHLVIHAAGRY